jgi:hypothetical protein
MLPAHPDSLLSRRALLGSALAGAGFAGVAGASLASNLSNYTMPAAANLPTGTIHDFDFLIGNWRSVNRRLKKRWVGSDEWDVFPNTLRCESRLDRMVNIDEAVFTTKGWSGMTIRVFNPHDRRWSLYWISGQTGTLFPPVVGGFNGDYGEFWGDDTDAGRPIKVVFRWRRLGPDKAHWEQAFSLDGKEWETNWRIEHTRVKS